MDIEALKERLQALADENAALKAKAEGEKRDWTVEEAAQFDANLEAFNQTKKNIERLQELEDHQAILKAPTGRKTKPEQPATLTADDEPETLNPPKAPGRKIDIRPVENMAMTKTGGFRNLGEMAWHVARASRDGGLTDPRLERLASASTYGNEASGADGGFAIPPDFRTSIMTTIMAEDSLLSRCDQVTVSGNTFTCPVDETTPWQTSGGILAVWDGEAAAATQSKPNLGERTVKLNKLRALVPMTEELLEDAGAMDSYLRMKAPQKIAFKINDAILNGTGTGMPLGITNSGAKIDVAKESPQTSATLIARNVIKMYNRMYGPCRSNAVWLYNQAIEPELFKLSIPGTDNAGNAVTGWGGLVYLPANGLSGSPFGTLFGRPCIPTQACADLGTSGDIIFIDLKQYLAILKGGPNPRLDVSMHLWFDQDLTAFKFTLRMGGVPWWSTTAAAKNGSATYSPYITLQTR